MNAPLELTGLTYSWGATGFCNVTAPEFLMATRIDGVVLARSTTVRPSAPVNQVLPDDLVGPACYVFDDREEQPMPGVRRRENNQIDLIPTPAWFRLVGLSTVEQARKYWPSFAVAVDGTDTILVRHPKSGEECMGRPVWVTGQHGVVVPGLHQDDGLSEPTIQAIRPNAILSYLWQTLACPDEDWFSVGCREWNGDETV